MVEVTETAPVTELAAVVDFAQEVKELVRPPASRLIHSCDLSPHVGHVPSRRSAPGLTREILVPVDVMRLGPPRPRAGRVVLLPTTIA